MENKSIVLIAFHNSAALGVRYLDIALRKKGFKVRIIFFKSFNSHAPCSPTAEEYELLKKTVCEAQPFAVGLSVMSSMYLETVVGVHKAVRDACDVPIIWGGVYASMFPERCLDHGADFIIRGEGETAICALCSAILDGTDPYGIENLSYKTADGKTVNNPLGALCCDLDSLGYPVPGQGDICVIDKNKVFEGDPQVNAINYQIIGSRGCPYSCAYCNAGDIRRLYGNGGKYLRFRSIDSIMDELKAAKAAMKNLRTIRFWDEIFPTDPQWVEEFCRRYKQEIGLPFGIWAHPLKTDLNLMTKMVDAGLYDAVMGIQSGSVRVRHDVFGRAETNEQVLAAADAMQKAGVAHITYDFMLQHDFETDEDIRQTYELCSQLKTPFDLQIHGMSYFPGSRIADMAVKAGFFTKEELDEKMHNSSLKEQFSVFWRGTNISKDSDFWYKLTYLTQYPGKREKAAKIAASSPRDYAACDKLYNSAKKIERARYYTKKAIPVFKSFFIHR